VSSVAANVASSCQECCDAKQSVVVIEAAAPCDNGNWARNARTCRAGAEFGIHAPKELERTHDQRVKDDLEAVVE